MTGVLIIRQPHTEVELEAMYNLRWRILREPWDQPRGSERDEKENDAMKFIALLNNQVIGTARFHKITDHVGQIRYVAVDEAFQNKTIGTNLMSSIHMTARNKRMRYIILNARETAERFFKKLGYTVVEPGPTLFGVIKHFKMKKRL